MACQDALADLKETEASLYEQRFENIQAEYEGILQGYEHTESMLNEYISQAEAKGHIVSKKYYQALIKNERNNVASLRAEQSALIKARDEAVASGKITRGSEAWRNMCAEIDGVTQSIAEAETQTIEWNNAIRDIDWQVFDLIQERISDVTAEADFLIDLMSNDKLFDDNGKLTDKGMATMGLHGQNYNTYMYQSDEYGKEIADIDKQLAKGYDGVLYERRQELIEAQRESILAAEDEKQAIRDLVEEGINLELDALQERIDKHNEELDSMKDLYEYQKKVKEQTEEIASLEKQMAAYSGDDSEEAKAKVQELRVSLEEAKTDLQESEYDKYISDQSALLDELYNAYSETLNTRLDDLNGLVDGVINEVNTNATTISNTLTTTAESVGTTLSEEMKNIWATEGAATKVVGTYGGTLTTINTTLDGIKTAVNTLAGISDKEAEDTINDDKTDTSADDNPPKDPNPSKTEEPKTEDKKVTEDTLKGVAAAIWIQGKNSGWGNNPLRENKLAKKLGKENALKVQQYINKYGANGKLYEFGVKKKFNLGKYQYAAFASGSRRIDESQLAWTQEQGTEYIVRPSDGAILTPVAKGDSVLTSAASNNIWDMANSPAEFIKDNLRLDASNVPNNSTVQSSYVQNFENITFSLPNVHGYTELLTEMQRDPKFEKLILSMTIDRIAGKSSLSKGKSIR